MNQWLDFNTNPTTFNTKLKPGSHDGKIIKEFGGREIAHQYRDQYSEANGVSSSVHTVNRLKSLDNHPSMARGLTRGSHADLRWPPPARRHSAAGELRVRPAVAPGPRNHTSSCKKARAKNAAFKVADIFGGRRREQHLLDPGMF